jgi:hypothetical protein
MEVINKGILNALEMLGLGNNQPQQGKGLMSAVAGMPRPEGKPSAPVLNKDLLKRSIIAVETGGEKDPYIFTKGSSKSSAFGPAQITYTLAEDVLGRSPNVPDSPEFINYVQSFIQQGKKRINAYENNPKKVNKSLRGGAKGLVSTELHKKHYPMLLDLALSLKMKDANSTHPGKIAKAWYGNTDAKASGVYVNKVMKKYMGEKNGR